MPRQKTIQVEAVLEGITNLKDGGLSVRFHTQELSAKDKLKLQEFYQKFGWLMFSDQTHRAAPKEIPVREAGVKTPSQRLRNTMYVFWRDYSGQTDQPFDEEWYPKHIEKIIEAYKGRMA